MSDNNATPVFVLVPGAWMGAWAWEPVTQELRSGGFQVFPLTLSGVSRDTDSTNVGLATHVSAVQAVLEENDLHDVILVGHSYSGIVVGQVADRVPERVKHTVYVDAFLPHSGKSMLDAFSEAQRADELKQIADHGGLWPAPEVAGAADGHGLSQEQAQWLVERLVNHPGRTVSEPAVLGRPLSKQNATYILCSFELSGDVAALRAEPSWTFRKLEAGHWPMVSTPHELTALLEEAAAVYQRTERS